METSCMRVNAALARGGVSACSWRLGTKLRKNKQTGTLGRGCAHTGDQASKEE